MRCSEPARATGPSIDTLRFYEDEGASLRLRAAGGYRDIEQLSRLRDALVLLLKVPDTEVAAFIGSFSPDKVPRKNGRSAGAAPPSGG
ncbi:MerR family transcriptional regulator [Nocardiopsis ansamitocini]|uniref:HTH merR-type domain-containing protein n=1 Tax=Nocardiopsis ansamitocini TaxID=1670832 RepID=A0A9W6PAZ5_9ACTN|nr:MerR family transcriptional regulator [Nocardiopsis ansamitocini]GLU50213.1 hypothetical protein Nans01_45640 [Nocardiopsis ansamitocini]